MPHNLRGSADHQRWYSIRFWKDQLGNASNPVSNLRSG
ncbi:hypothetical protein RISK_002800 [Rhodopirellula islandica]|uniref:Uncharacterized protein n=1 Tax=Rhodopirellula islandica TaxID=595434 RepID=A0A0J1BEM7_RHOIS|nr:hypothetical protein RISK_002800 [Rhodopirellula islandica]